MQKAPRRSSAGGFLPENAVSPSDCGSLIHSFDMPRAPATWPGPSLIPRIRSGGSGQAGAGGRRITSASRERSPHTGA
jgi:hypothetical protein